MTQPAGALPETVPMPIDKKPPAGRRIYHRPERFEGLAAQVRSAGDGSSRLGESGLATSIGFLLRLANGVTQGELASRFGPLGLRTTLYSVLLIIHENPGLKQQEVGQTLSIQQPNLVALINELVAAGLVSRDINADDRRSYSLSLTSAGRTRLAQAERTHAENERRLADAVAPVPLEAFRAALLRIAEIPAEATESIEEG
ncbi:MAG: MarR family transcriptional regulator [Alphaproteobacteria bacterium]|nr:MarR family transcriptional regulator [Alphaproteobacteria bacterium]